MGEWGTRPSCQKSGGTPLHPWLIEIYDNNNLGAINADDTVEVSGAVVIVRHADCFTAQCQPLLLRVRINVKHMRSGREYRQLTDIHITSQLHSSISRYTSRQYVGYTALPRQLYIHNSSLNIYTGLIMITYEVTKTQPMYVGCVLRSI